LASDQYDQYGIEVGESDISLIWCQVGSMSYDLDDAREHLKRTHSMTPSITGDQTFPSMVSQPGER
jgi:hypothetical protein